ncbi:MAG: hypothetical protein JW801_09665 [Bacteroidales bacterium]|nr:hypothetical protein [Bacteroidales bacterium]
MTTIFQDDQVCVSFDETVPCVIWRQEGFIKGEKFRIPFDKGMDFMEKNIGKYPSMGWMNDTRKLKTVGLEDIKWLNQTFNARTLKLSHAKVCFVLPESAFGRLAIKMYVEFTNKRSNNNLEIKAFREIDTARKWLASATETVEGEAI